jgi:hypothetical protein
MRSQPTRTPGRRVVALVIGALLLGAASVGLDAATAHAATSGPPVTTAGGGISVIADAGVRGWPPTKVVSKGARC